MIEKKKFYEVEERRGGKIIMDIFDDLNALREMLLTCNTRGLIISLIRKTFL